MSVIVLDNFTLPAGVRKPSEVADLEVGQAKLFQAVDPKAHNRIGGAVTAHKKRSGQKLISRIFRDPAPGLPEGLEYPVLVVQRIG